MPWHLDAKVQLTKHHHVLEHRRQRIAPLRPWRAQQVAELSEHIVEPSAARTALFRRVRVALAGEMAVQYGTKAKRLCITMFESTTICLKAKRPHNGLV